MSFRSFLAPRRPVGTLARGRAADRRARGRPPRASLAVQALEDRTAPSTFTVLNLADGGDGSLRQAVLDANSPAYAGADVINFAAGLQGTIALGGVPLSITDHLTIEGPGAELVAVSGEDASRVFEIGAGVAAVLDGLTITRGRAVDGGGISNAGTLTVSHCTLSANQAVGGAGHDARGGGIFNEAPAVLTVTHSLFSNNRAVGGDGGPGVHGGEGAGGGIYNLDATLTVSNSTFTGNQAVGGDGGLGAGGGIANGGALASEGIGGPAVLSVSHSTLSGNQATGGIGGVFVTEDSDGHGGAVFNRGSTTFLLSHSTVSDNAATGRARRTGRVAGNGNGGGLLLSVTAVGPTSILIDSCDFTGNRATGGAGGAGASGGQGQAGAIRTSTRLTGGGPPGTLVVSRCTFIGNQATGGAGGAGASGGLGQGGAYQTIGVNWTIAFSRSTFSGNQATGGAGGMGGNGGGGRGGGCIFNSSTVYLEYVDITGNQATGGAAGAGGQDGQGIGGGVYINSGLVSARRTTISGNHASTSHDDLFDPLA